MPDVERPQLPWDHELTAICQNPADWLWRGFVACGNLTLITQPVERPASAGYTTAAQREVHVKEMDNRLGPLRQRDQRPVRQYKGWHWHCPQRQYNRRKCS